MNIANPSDILRRSVETLDIPPYIADEAIAEFGEVALWLGEESSPLSAYNPELYPQGSFRLGTPVRPYGERTDFDIDLVCTLSLAKENTTQRNLKALVGDRLKAHAEFRKRISELRRCWTLLYRPRFHLDVLPSIPDVEHGGTGILLTDKDLTRWQFSNPIGYSEWFFDRMRHLLLEERAALAKAAGANIEEVPEWRVRTPLQRAVQLMKRHRDVRFHEDPDNRPVSIIITTLAGHAYRQQADLAATLLDLVGRMPQYIEKRGDKWWVANPAHPEENFADKWNETPARRDAFLKWLEQLGNDVQLLGNVASRRDGERLVESRWAPGLSASAPATVPAVQVPLADGVAHALTPPWSERLSYKCSVDVGVHSRFRQGARLHFLRSFTLKRSGLRFEARTDTPAPYEIWWQVLNTGSEARGAGDLRGRFERGEGVRGEIKWERASYAGTHFVEAFVVKGGLVVAKSGRVPVRIATVFRR